MWWTTPRPLDKYALTEQSSDARSRDQTIQEIDLVRGDAGAIGRRGQGPGEYQFAATLLPWAGDSTAVVDGANGRLLLIGPDAKPAGVIRNFGETAVTARIQAADARGMMYMAVSGPAARGAEFVPRDSQSLQRLDPRSGRSERIAAVATAASQIRVNRTGKDVTSVEVSRPPFAVGDEWDVAPDGRVAIIRRDGYRLDQVMPDGRLMRGPTISVPVLKVTEADKKEHIAALPSAARARADALPWPETRPPFPLRAVLALPNGETWVRRNQPAGASTTRYDVFGGSGTLVARLVLSADRRVVAVTSRWIYVARTDDDGLQYLEGDPAR